MAKPLIHAKSSARKFGGEPEDYLEIHDFMDSSKAAFPDNRHRALTHNSWFVFVVEKCFGHTIDVKIRCTKCRGDKWADSYPCRQPCWKCNATGQETKQVSVRDICEQHILEDFGNKFIPTVSDYLEGMEFQDWMNNAMKGAPTSHRKIANKVKERKVLVNLD